MKCIDRKKRAIFAVLVLSLVILSGCGQEVTIENAYDVYESSNAYGLNSAATDEESHSFFAKDLCVTGSDNQLSEGVSDALSEAAGLFNLKEGDLKFGKNIFQRVYPASTTKILTAYVALKHGDLSATATVTEEELQLEQGSTICELSVGDTVSLEQLLYGLMLCSGNDATNVIADMISGSTEAFAELMNQEALALGATNSHFVNPHGLHNENHYTTVYDMYLIFQEAIQNEQFVSIINSESHTGTFTSSDGQAITKNWRNSNKFINGEAKAPEGIQVVGGKTGTTGDAGYCLVLYSKNAQEDPWISIVYKSNSRDNLYKEMTELLEEISK